MPFYKAAEWRYVAKAVTTQQRTLAAAAAATAGRWPPYNIYSLPVSRGLENAETDAKYPRRFRLSPNPPQIPTVTNPSPGEGKKNGHQSTNETRQSMTSNTSTK